MARKAGSLRFKAIPSSGGSEPALARDQALNAKERANARVLEPTLEDENQDPNYRHVGSDGMGELGKRCLNYNLELFDIDHDVVF